MLFFFGGGYFYVLFCPCPGSVYPYDTSMKHTNGCRFKYCNCMAEEESVIICFLGG